MSDDFVPPEKPAKESLIKRLLIQKINELRPDIDWTQIRFVESPSGRLIRITSRDPEVDAWLKHIIIG